MLPAVSQAADLAPGFGRSPAKVHTLERKVSVHERNIAELVDSMAGLLATPPAPPKRPIGFVLPEDKSKKGAASARRKS